MATGIVIALVLWARFDPAWAVAFVAGCAWSLVNVHLLRVLVGFLVAHTGGRKLKIVAVLVAKLPVLYGAGYLLLDSGRLPIAGLLVGFAWPLSVVVLKAAGRLILGLDRAARGLDHGGPGCAGETQTRRGG